YAPAFRFTIIVFDAPGLITPDLNLVAPLLVLTIVKSWPNLPLFVNVIAVGPGFRMLSLPNCADTSCRLTNLKSSIVTDAVWGAACLLLPAAAERGAATPTAATSATPMTTILLTSASLVEAAPRRRRWAVVVTTEYGRLAGPVQIPGL